DGIDDRALQATPPSPTSAAPSVAIRAQGRVAIRVRGRAKRISMTFSKPRKKCPDPLTETTRGRRRFRRSPRAGRGPPGSMPTPRSYYQVECDRKFVLAADSQRRALALA